MEHQEIKFSSALLEQIRRANWITVLTGAGVSAESNVPTFREAQTGLWAKFDSQELATPQAFARNPRLVWEWYTWRQQMISQAKPNAGHIAISQMENFLIQSGKRFVLLTQNVDGLHQKAGSQAIVELHGNIQRTRCTRENILVETHLEKDSLPPHCPRCGATLRPDVVWFGENISIEAITSALDAARNCDLFFSIGTSSVVEPAASLPLIAIRNKAMLVEINPGITPLISFAHFAYQARAGTALPQLVKAAWGR